VIPVKNATGTENTEIWRIPAEIGNLGIDLLRSLVGNSWRTIQIHHYQTRLLAIVETLKEFNGMLWGQWINVCTDQHKNLTRDGLGLTSDRVTRLRILLEEYAPEIIYIKGIHNTVADAISQLEYDPKLNSTNEYNHATHVMSVKEEANQKWLMYSKFWSRYNKMQGDTYECKMIY